MGWTLLLIALAGVPETVATAEVAQCELRPIVQDGTLLFSQGDCLVVKAYTCSTLTHVAGVVVEPDGPVVYEATGGAGVRKMTLARYLEIHGPRPLLVYQPARKFDEKQAVAWAAYLKSQLGKKYAVRQVVFGDSDKHQQCAEYMTRALIDAHVLTAKNPATVSPSSLEESVRVNDVYSHAVTVHIVEPPPPEVHDQTWCRWAWYSTRDCTVACAMKLSRMFCCK